MTLKLNWTNIVELSCECLLHLYNFMEMNQENRPIRLARWSYGETTFPVVSSSARNAFALLLGDRETVEGR